MADDISYDSLEALQQRLARMTEPAFAQQIGERAGRKVGEQLRYVLAKYPGPSHSPVLWRNNKQAQAY